MTRTRWAALGVAALSCLSACSGNSAATAVPLRTTTTVATSVASDPPATTTTTRLLPTTTTTVPFLKVPLDHTVKKKEHSEAVAYIQDRLIKLGFDPGPVDGTFGTSLEESVWAYQEMIGLSGKDVTGEVTPQLWDRMQDVLDIKARDAPLTQIRHVEIYIPQQVLILFDDGGAVKLISHTSTGSGQDWCERGWCGHAVTPGGIYAVQRFHPEWELAPLGLLYNAVYFNGGIAMHGALIVPNYPASHGCIRLPLHISIYFHTLVQRGDPVLVYDGVRDPRDYGSPAPPVNTSDPKATTTTIPPSTTAPATTSTTRASTSSSV